MTSKRQKQHPQLEVPVPKFPLSSPITEEISSPSCSSAEERELERNRPFDFLVKATNKRIEKNSAEDGARSPRSPESTRRDRPSDFSRLSVRGITKRRKNTSKPVGLNLVTDFTLATPPKKLSNGSSNAQFVDLNDLKQLCKTREKERSAQKAKAITKDSTPSCQLPSDRLEQSSEYSSVLQTNNPFLDPGVENPFSDRSDHGLSPSDRNVMIGLAVPRDESLERSKEIDSAGDQHTPLTPSIIVTPARENVPWSIPSIPDPRTTRPRAASSVYSQPTPRPWDSDIPPVPAIPEEHTMNAKRALDSEFLSAHYVAATRERRCSISTETILDDDCLEQDRAQSVVDDDDQAPLRDLNVNTEIARPQSQGWWTYLLSPLLGRKSPISPGFPRGEPSSAESTKAISTGKKWWEKEKEVSCFSPETPETTMTEWWNDDGKKSLEQSRSMPIQDEIKTALTSNTIDDLDVTERAFNRGRQTTASVMFGGRSIQGEAAEYYQACAHELFSKTPYFECFNHICSITPPHAIPNGLEAEAGETRDRGLILAEAGAPNRTPPEKSIKGLDDAGNARELLVDVDPPAGTNCKQVDSQPSEKTQVEPPQTTKGLVPMPEPEPTPTPTPAAVFHEPAPLPIESSREQSSASPPHIINNVHYAPPPVAAPPQPAVTVERVLPHYIPVFPPDHGNPGPRLVPIQHDPQPGGVSTLEETTRRPDWPCKGSQPQAPNEQPAPQETSPISPAFQRAAGGPGSIALSEVHAPAPAYSQYSRDAPLPPRCDFYSASRAAVMNPTGLPGPGEAQRRRLEREDAAGREVGGLWRGRGCFSNKGCFGRPGREGRLRRRWYLLICSSFLIIVIVAIALATTLIRHGDTTPVQSQWLNLTGYPPMPTGIATIAGAETTIADSSCIKPSSLWSCALPQDQQLANKPYATNSPNFRVEIRFRNGTYSHSTNTVPAASINKLRRSENALWTANPAAPILADQTFLGNTTDGNSIPYAGEDTPFYISILSPVPLSSTNLYRRSSNDNSSVFPNLTAIIPPPAENPDGTAAAATLYPLPDSQPVRLYNRGKSDEHYGFYTYFDKSIFLSSRASLDGSTIDTNPADANGGVERSNANVRCTWSQTRFLVQIWTQPSSMGYSLLPPSDPSPSSTPTPTPSSTPTSSATDYTRPGSFPYPVTITLDRHGGIEKQKMVYCYGIESDGHYNISDVKLQLEDRGIGGSLVNPASGIFTHLDGGSSSNSSLNSSVDSLYGGIDGGSGGCQCQWVNWISTV